MILGSIGVIDSNTFDGFVTDGLILKYDVSDSSSYSGSGTTVTDLIGNSNATLINTPTYSSQSVKYLSFDGVNEYLITNTSLNPDLSPANTSTVISYFIWVYPQDNGVIITEQGSTSLNSGWHDSQIEIVSGTLKFSVWPHGAAITSSISIPLNNWYYLGISYNGTTLTAYVNGQSAGSTNISRQTPYNDGGVGLYYGIAATDSTNLGDGSYAKMRFGAFQVYNTALTSTQVLSNYNSQKSTYALNLPSNVLLLDAANYTSGSTWTDLSEDKKDGTLYNSPTWNQSGGYFTLNGTNQYVQLPEGFSDFTSGITILSFMDFGASSNWERIIDFGRGQADENIIFAREGTTNTLTLELYDGNTISLAVDLPNGVIDNGWGFYGFKSDGSTYKIFNHLTSTSGSSTVLPNNISRTNNYIGRSNWSADSYFQRYVGVVAIFNTALSDVQIDQFFDYYRNRYGL